MFFFYHRLELIVIGVSHNPQPLSASILFPGLPLHFSDINSAFEKCIETFFFFFFFFSRKLGISNRKDNMSLLFFDWCRRLAFRDAIQKFCPFPVSFFFFFWWPEGRVSLLLKKYCTCLSIHAVEILCHTGGWRSVLLQILGCKIATCEKVRIAGRYCGGRSWLCTATSEQLLAFRIFVFLSNFCAQYCFRAHI